jgi:hypothetical protein
LNPRSEADKKIGPKCYRKKIRVIEQITGGKLKNECSWYRPDLLFQFFSSGLSPEKEDFMTDIMGVVKKTMMTGIGLALKTKDEVEDWARDLVTRGELSENEGEKFDKR